LLQYHDESPVDVMTVDLYPTTGAAKAPVLSTAFTLYEDDGVTRQAVGDGTAFSKTTLGLSLGAGAVKAANISFAVGGAQGAGYAGQRPTRGWWLQFHIGKGTPPLDVALQLAGVESVAQKYNSISALDYSAGFGWTFEAHGSSAAQKNGGVVYVKVPAMPVAGAFTVVLSKGERYAHIALVTCDAPTHRQVQPQVFKYTAGGASTGGSIVEASTGMCVTVGRDNDPASGTPAVELQTCVAGNKAQGFDFKVIDGTPTLGQLVQVSTGRCIDQDGTDHMAEMYGCGKPGQANQVRGAAWCTVTVCSTASARGHLVPELDQCVFPPPASPSPHPRPPPLQAWIMNPGGTGHVQTAHSGLCMSVLP
jgi:hypothetical protein